MNPQPTLLIVSFHFAPSPLVGAKRFSFLAREFTRMGFDVHVITNDISESVHGREDSSLPISGAVHRCAAPFTAPLKGKSALTRLANAVLRRLLAPVGMDYFWARAATRTALEVAAKLPRGVVIATSPPHAALIAGARIARRLRWPLILDYRDPWSAYDWPYWHRGWLTQWLGARIEARLLRRSAARVLNTADMRDWFEESFPHAAASANFVVPNGFDAAPTSLTPSSTGTIEIVHAGEIYGSRSLVPLLRAVKQLASRHPARPILVTTYGALPAAERQRIQDAALGQFIEERPRIPFAALFTALQRAHLLLAVVSDHMTYSTPYKIYDYMAAGRPILGLAPRGAALHELLAESGAGSCVDPADIDGIERELERMLFGGDPIAQTRIERFRWSNLAQQYRSVIDAVAGAGTRSSTTEARDLPASAGFSDFNR
ncbi:MAG TPA: glycosyltransferase [Steroidobacteraceae bacterium]|jgi:glycosyltransferase involved in cell wall biosynthesis|nr:glycosyltransferase [Steroidobacteraceae bacterium]